MPEPSEEFWKLLLLYIEDGKVVPVVGPELVTIREGEQDVALYGWLARRLAEAIALPVAELPSPFDLNDVVSAHLRRDPAHDRTGLYAQIRLILGDAELAPGSPLRALAGIPNLNLFVSLTFDSLLVDAIARERRGVQAQPISYSMAALPDLPADKSALARPVVFHLFGRASSSPDYAICDDDLLEFLHALQDKQRQPKKLFDELRTSHLLMLGCGYGDWLARFFLRTARDLELKQKRNYWDVLADARPGREPALAVFLSSYSTDTKLQPMPAAEFVTQLAERWHRAHPDAPPRAAAVPAAADDAAQPTPPDGAVFVSYCSDNREAAERLVSGLRAARVDVWFDQRELRPADDWGRRIVRGIEGCALFVPVISREALDPANRRRYFWGEWNAAAESSRSMAPDEEFILAVAVDGTPLDDPGLPAAFRRKQGSTLAGGEATPEFAARLKALQRDFRSRRRRRP